jgi:DNA-binding MarR family transcriptional regulator
MSRLEQRTRGRQRRGWPESRGLWRRTREKSATHFLPPRHYRKARGEFGEWLEQELAKAAEDDEWDLYEKISEAPSLNVYELAKRMGWSTGKTRGAVKRLEEEGLIKIEKSIRNGRAVGLVTATPWQEMLTPKERDEFKKMEV